ncbi:unnamed protein product [Parascedosporium putredinis]|uniref:Crossover junction endonuclease MUS81 n=1 Tax=Parascedosporium putredinis TaxID=1442378 RepID=A0A9P1H789_9PEZI|nr:unnamed protein product [Parascedosporium putredinis]CAI7998667.1 unnamed protein product [Parascedosporium putredinis]
MTSRSSRTVAHFSYLRVATLESQSKHLGIILGRLRQHRKLKIWFFAMEEEERCANPLLLGWVKEWLDFAREKNSKGVLVYKHAYDALNSCPITFRHPSQLQQLKGFGPKLCQRLTDKLKAHCEENGLPMPSAGRRPAGLADAQAGTEELAPSPPKKRRKKKPYVPAYRSGAYAIVMALSSLDENTPGTQGLPKAQLIELAQPLCDSSFTALTGPTKFYTAWNSMRTLIDKDLVYEKEAHEEVHIDG